MIKVIKDNESWLIINKPSGTSVHNDSESVIEYFKSKNIETIPAHRIDKDTSGLLLLAKTSEKVASLQTSLSRSKKYYLAVCRGKTQVPSGTWSDPLSDKAEGFKNPRGKKSELKSCITNWSLVHANKYFSLILFQIETGRTHQIRRHCAIHKLEIIGDKRYGDSKYQKLIKSKYNFTNMALHSYRLDIEIDGLAESFQAKAPLYFDTIMGEEIEKFL
ncbi:RluA family pseudouridine synthase [Halobacteriovorax sp.]|uniref:RluA family pseudouridine synthase n=1 Tax=Halobacteriovorax sp. TaxID=2020862 RepID=UPI0035644F8D